MFIGHFAAGFAAKRLVPRVSLGTLFAAVQFQDLLWPLLLLAGLEHVRIDPGNTAVTPLDFTDYPYSHSLAGAALLAAVFGGVHWLVRRDGRSALVLAGASLSHWVLDFITHRPDLPLTFAGTEKVGIGLWNSLPGTLLLEAGMYAVGVIVYAKATGPARAAGRYGFAVLAAVLAAIYAANLFGPPPPGTEMIASAGNAMWLFVLAAWWVDRMRGGGRRAGGSR